MVVRPIDFKKDFLLFIAQNGISYAERGGMLLFPEYGLAVVPVFLKDFENGTEIREPLPQATVSGMDILYLYEDRWYHDSGIKERILARLGRFDSVFARKCRLISDREIKSDSVLIKRVREFLERYHSYGDAKCKYRYALEYGGKIVAAATFSFGRKISRDMADGAIVYDSYEWIRYASLPGCRIAGGMGRILKAFVSDLEEEGVPHIEIMSYSDNEWSCGAVYTTLGFERAGERSAVEYYVNRTDFERLSKRKLLKKEPSLEDSLNSGQIPPGYVRIRNMGSIKFLLHIG